MSDDSPLPGNLAMVVVVILVSVAGAVVGLGALTGLSG